MCRLTADEYSSLCSNLFVNIHVCRLTADEYSSLCSNLVDIVSVHKDLLSSLEDTLRFVVTLFKLNLLIIALLAIMIS